MARARRSKLLRDVAWCAAFGALGIAPFALGCGTKNGEVGLGGDCLITTDCTPGLVCVPQANKSHICTDNLTGSVGQAPTPAGADGSADAMDAVALPQPDATRADAGQDAGPTSDGAPDAGDG